VKTSVAATGAAVVLTNGEVFGANEEIRVGVIGIRGRGGGLIREFHDTKGVRVVGICDVDGEVLKKREREFTGRNEKINTYVDYRVMMEDKSIGVVAIATPDHHHVPAAARAVVMGKDVYVEKPVSHTIAEGRLLVDLARKHKRIVQHGTQSRSLEGFQKGIEFLRSGELGKIRMAKAINSQFRAPIGRESDGKAPDHVNYNLWLGPAPKRPFNPNRFHYNWHWHWDYGTGDTGNDGIHQIDIARWGLGVDLPKAVSCSGGQLFYDDDHETPDTQVATFEYDDVYLMYEMRLWTPYPLEGHDNGDIFYGDKGSMSMGRNGWQVTFKGGKKGPGGPRGGGSHVENFIQAVRTRKPEELNADVKEAHYSATLCHMANIAMRVGRKLKFDGGQERFIDDAEANTYLTKTYRKGFELPKL
jgi:predicted dehydrogenase